MSTLKPNPSIIVDYQAPEFIRSDYAKFITFLQKYYQYLEQSNKALDVIRNLESYNDIDEQTNDAVLTSFYTLFLPDFPQVVRADKKFVLKNIVEFYNSKGSIDSVKSFFRILYGEEVEIYLPKVDVLKLDAGVWNKVFKIKIYNLSSGTIGDLVNSEIYQIDAVNGNKTVRARVVDYDPSDSLLYLSADNVILNFSSTSIVYAINSQGSNVTFNLYTQLGETSITYTGIGYEPGDSAILSTAVSNTENIKVENVTKGRVKSLVLRNAGDDYSIFDTISFGTLGVGERAASAKITSTINKDFISEGGSFKWAEQEDKLLFEDDFEFRQEVGNFGTELATPNLKLTDEATSNLNTGSISSNEFGFLLEQQNEEIVTYSRASYTYNQGMYRAILPRVGAESNYSLNWARNEGVSLKLIDEELWISSINCTTGTPSNPGTVIIEFDTQVDYNALDYYELTTRSSVNAPVVTSIMSKHNDEKILDPKITGLSETQQVGLYEFGQQTLSELYPYSETGLSNESPILYIRERNTLFGHALNTTRPWEYRFVFKRNTKVNLKVYIMPVQYDINATLLLDEDGSEYRGESSGDDLFILENWEPVVNVNSFDPATDVASNEITLPSHGFKQGEIIRYNTTTDPITGAASQSLTGAVDGEIFYCHVVNSNTIKLMPYGTTREYVTDNIFRTLTPPVTTGTVNTFCTFVGAHVTSGVDYTSTNVEDSAISIYARKRACGSRDLALKYSVDPNIPTDADTNLRTTYPYTVDNKVYLYQSLLEHVDSIVMEREEFQAGDQVNLALEIDKRSPEEEEGYVTYPYIALESSAEEVVHHNGDINIPDYSSVRVMVERKAIQSVDDINRGSNRASTIWNDYADISIAQQLFDVVRPSYEDEYSTSPYLTVAYPKNTSDYISGPSEFSNLGATTMLASSKNTSVYYSDGAASGLFKTAAEFDEQRRISFFEQRYYDNDPMLPTPENGPLGITSGSSGAYATNKKKFFTIGFSLPEELNTEFDLPFEVNLKNIIDNNLSTSTQNRDLRTPVSLQESIIPGDSVYLMENGDTLVYEIDDNGFNSLAQGNQSIKDDVIVVEFFSPSLAASNPKKHLVYYSNRAEYSKISSDVQRTIYQFLNCWSPNVIGIPDTTVKDYTVSIRCLHKSDNIIEKVSDTQLLTTTPSSSVVDGVYVSPFIRDLYIKKGQNDYGKYLKFYETEADAIADTNSLVPFSLGSDFGSNAVGNELFYNPITSGTTVNSAYNNPINKSLFGAYDEKNISISRYFDPSTDVTTGTPGIITINNHGLVNGSWVRFRADFNGTVPTGLTDDTTYYINALTLNTIRLATNKDNLDSGTYVNITAFATAGKTCSLQTIPQSFTFNSVKELSFDARKYVDTATITTVDTISSIVTTDIQHTLRTLNTMKYTTTGTPIGGLVDQRTYYSIFVTDTQLKIADSKEDAALGIFIPLTSAGTGTHSLQIFGSSGNMLPNNTSKEQFLYTAGQYKNVLKDGDSVKFYNQRQVSPSVSSGTTMYVKSSVTGSDEAFTLTTNEDGTTSNFGFNSTLSASVNATTDTITFSPAHTFYTGDEIVYTTAGTVIGGLTSGSTYYVIRVSSTQIQLAESNENAIGGVKKDLTTAGSGTHYFAKTNFNTASEINEVVPQSTILNIANALNPSTTGTGYEEFTILYSPTLQTETGVIENLRLTSSGSYSRIPQMSISTPGRYGSGAEIYAIVEDVGGVTSFEILDGGIHSTNRTLLLPFVFISDNITGVFEIGETIKLGSTEIGTLQSKRDRYFKIKQNGSGTAVTYGNTVTGLTSGATAYVGRDLTITGISLSDTCQFTTNSAHYLSNGDEIYLSGATAQGITNGIYYVSPTSSDTFRLYSDDDLSTPVDTSAGTAYVSGATAKTGLYTAKATASPTAITSSTAAGATENYDGDKQLIGPTMKIQDSYYYQDYSYVVRGANSLDDWKPYFNKLVHPAGMASFGEVDYFTTSSAREKLGATQVSGSSINNTSTAITTETTDS
jgi:hypothetical protein